MNTGKKLDHENKINKWAERKREEGKKKKISTNLAHCSAEQRDDWIVAIANKSTSKWVAGTRYCPAACSGRSRSHVFPSLGFPGLRWFPSTPGSDPVYLNTGDHDTKKPKNKFVCVWTLTGSPVRPPRRQPHDGDRSENNRTEIVEQWWKRNRTWQRVTWTGPTRACGRLTYKRVRSQVCRAEAAAGARHIAQS